MIICIGSQLVAEIFTLTGAHVRTLSLSNVGADIFVSGLLVSVPTNSVYVCGSQRSQSYSVTISRVRCAVFRYFHCSAHVCDKKCNIHVASCCACDVV